MSPECYPMTIMPVLNRIIEQLQGQRCWGGARWDFGVIVAAVWGRDWIPSLPLQTSPDGHHSPSTSAKNNSSDPQVKKWSQHSVSYLGVLFWRLKQIVGLHSSNFLYSGKFILQNREINDFLKDVPDALGTANNKLSSVKFPVQLILFSIL